MTPLLRTLLLGLLLPIMALSIFGAPQEFVPKDLSIPPLQDCLTCKGNGTVKMPCDHCEGDGKGPCVDCTDQWGAFFDAKRAAVVAGLRAERRSKRRPVELPEDATEEQIELHRLLTEMSEALDGIEDLAGTSRSYPGYLSSVPAGRRPCPANCRARASRSFDPCLVCDGEATVGCRPCKGKGEARCAACKGKRKQPVVCQECAGSGKTTGDHPGADDFRVCPWCAGAIMRPCQVCDQRGEATSTCHICAGAGKTTCASCLGSKNCRCYVCDGTGVKRARGQVPAAKEKCSVCKGKGLQRCEACTRGKVACVPCAGKGQATSPCVVCFGYRRAPCGGCAAGSALAWTVSADRLVSAGEFEAAKAYIDEAVRRTTVRNGEQMRRFKGKAKEARALKGRLDAELDRIRKRAAAIAKKAGNGGG